MIQVKDLTRAYGGRIAVDSISFEVEKGEIVGFLGPNGAGKSTTLKILTGYLAATSGSASVAGFDVFTHSIQARQQIGYMPENVPLYTDMRVKEYLQFRAGLKGMRGHQLRRRVGVVMETCGLTEVRRKMIGNLSKGFRQRVGLADALVHEPELLILDEPTNGLDPKQIRQVRELIRSLAEKHTILVSTHILAEVEVTCSRVLIIDQGKLKASDTPANLIGRVRSSGNVFAEIRAETESTAKALKKLKDVRKIESSAMEDGWVRYEIRPQANTDPREAIHQLCASRTLALRELSRQKPTLEDVFVELTTQGNAANS